MSRFQNPIEADFAHKKGHSGALQPQFNQVGVV